MFTIDKVHLNGRIYLTNPFKRIIIYLTNISGHKKPYDNCITRNLKSKQKRGNFMKVKLKKHKKSPAPCVTEQVKEVSTIEKLGKAISFYGFPRKIIFDNYKPATSKNN